MVVSSFQLLNKMNKTYIGRHFVRNDFTLIKGINIWIDFKMQLIPILYDAKSIENIKYN